MFCNKELLNGTEKGWTPEFSEASIDRVRIQDYFEKPHIALMCMYL